MNKLIDHIYIVSTLLFTVYSQVVMRWQVSRAGDLPVDLMGKVHFIEQQFLNPWVLSSIIATFLSGLSWMMVMSRFEISYAYPWVSLNFVLMLLLGSIFFGESFTATKALGTLLIILGILVIVRRS